MPGWSPCARPWVRPASSICSRAISCRASVERNMHEMGIACSVLAAVQAEAGRFPDKAIRKVGVRIGEMSALDPEALRFCFEAMTRDTELASLELGIEICPFR